MSTHSGPATNNRVPGLDLLGTDAPEHLVVVVLAQLLHPSNSPTSTNTDFQGVLVAYFPEADIAAPAGFAQRRAGTQDLLRASLVCKRWRRIVMQQVVRSVHAASLETSQFVSLAMFLQRAAPVLRSIDLKMSLRHRSVRPPAPFFNPFIRPLAAQLTCLTSLTLPAYELGLPPPTAPSVPGLLSLRALDAQMNELSCAPQFNWRQPEQIGTRAAGVAGGIDSASGTDRASPRQASMGMHPALILPGLTRLDCGVVIPYATDLQSLSSVTTLRALDVKGPRLVRGMGSTP